MKDKSDLSTETLVSVGPGELVPRGLQETYTAEEIQHVETLAKQAEEARKSLTKRMVKSSAKAGILGLENADAIIGSFQTTVLVPAITLLISTGQILDAMLVFAVFAGLQIVKIRIGQGPVILFFARANKQEIKQKLVSLSKTIYR